MEAGYIGVSIAFLRFLHQINPSTETNAAPPPPTIKGKESNDTNPSIESDSEGTAVFASTGVVGTGFTSSTGSFVTSAGLITLIGVASFIASSGGVVFIDSKGAIGFIVSRFTTGFVTSTGTIGSISFAASTGFVSSTGTTGTTTDSIGFIASTGFAASIGAATGSVVSAGAT